MCGEIFEKSFSNFPLIHQLVVVSVQYERFVFVRRVNKMVVFVDDGLLIVSVGDFFS